MTLPGSGLFPLLFMIVPAIMLIAGLVILFRGVRVLRSVRRVERVGQRGTGTVVGSHVRVSGGGSSNAVSSRLVETIEFRTLSGQSVRAAPLAGDVGMLDRTGQEVPIVYDPDRPEQFVAPKDGRRLGMGSSVLGIILVVVFLVVVVLIAVMSQQMLFGGGLLD